MEKLIHTSEGALRVDDPFREVGSRGQHVGNLDWGYVITQACVDAAIRREERRARPISKGRFYGLWVRGLNSGNVRFHSHEVSLLNKGEFKQLTPEDEKYFELPEKGNN